MHSRIGNHDKCTRKDAQTNDILPVRLRPEPERAQYRRPRHCNVQAVLFIDQRQVRHLVVNQRFEAVVEDG